MKSLATINHGEKIFDQKILKNITIELYQKIDSSFQDSNFYPNGLVLNILLLETPLIFQIKNLGESLVFLTNDEEGKTSITSWQDFRTLFFGGDVLLGAAANNNLLKWETSKEFELSLTSASSPETIISVICCSQSLPEIIRRGLNEARKWSSYSSLFNNNISEKRKITLVSKIDDKKVLRAIAAEPSLPEEVKVFAALRYNNES